MGGDQFDELHALQRDPYPLYARARQAEGLVFVPELDAWLLARHADVREVLGRPEDFSSANALRPDVTPSPAALTELARGLGGQLIVLVADGAAHRRLRRPLSTGLSSGRVAAIVPFIRERAEGLVDSFVSDGQVELVSGYARRLPGEVIGQLLGLAPADVPFAVRGSYRAEELVFHPLDEAEQVGAARDVVALQHMLDGYARRRNANPGDDLCSEMVLALAPGSAFGSRWSPTKAQLATVAPRNGKPDHHNVTVRHTLSRHSGSTRVNHRRNHHKIANMVEHR